MTSAMKRAMTAMMMVAMLGLGATKASAASIQFFFNDANGFGNQGSAPYGRLTLTEAGVDGVDDDILVIVELFNGLKFVTPFDVTIGFNLVGINSITYSDIPAGWTIPDQVGAAGQNATVPGSPARYSVDGFGNYEYGLNSPGSGGGSPQDSPIQFHVLATGITLYSFVELARTPGTPKYFAADVIGPNGGTTGAIGISEQPHIVPLCLRPPCSSELVTPEPASLVLLGTGLLGGVALVRRRRKTN